MTQPNGEQVPQLPGNRPIFTDYISLGFNQGENPAKWRRLPVSRLGSPVTVTIPWDVDYYDPKNHHGPGGWTVLQGPASYDLDVHIRCKNLEPGCSTHVSVYVVTKDENGVATEISGSEAPERFVGPLETSHTHIDGSFKGVLQAGEYLWVRMDYWNAGKNPDGTLKPQAQVYGNIVGASVRGFWGPIPDSYDQPTGGQ